MQTLSPTSYWFRRSPAMTSYPPLRRDCEVDVAVIGGGITGLTAAVHLKRAGRRVVVLEGGVIGGGTTGGSTGHLEVAPDEGFAQLIKDFGEQAAGEITVAKQRAIDQIESWSSQFRIDCDFRRVPGCLYAEHRDQVQQVNQEFDAARSIHLQVLPKLDAELPFPTAAAMQIPRQARIDSLAYIQGLARAIHGDLVTIHEHTRAEPPRDGQPCVIEANGCVVRAAAVIVATHCAFLGISQFDVRQAPYQSYVMSVRVKEEAPDALFWDTADPYYYLRRANSDDPHLLIIGGADHKTGERNATDHFRMLENYVRQHFCVQAIEDRWSAEYFEPSDGLPFIGRAPATSHLYLATGYSGTGLTYGTIGGQILADLILDRDPPVAAKYFAPGRITPLASATDFVTENLNAAYHFVADRFSAEPVDSLDAIAVGEGRLVKIDGQSFAAFRDEHGELHLMSPACTHAGCTVHWNNAERTWDCPCHGGRYSATGERLYGPPAADLETKEAPQPSH